MSCAFISKTALLFHKGCSSGSSFRVSRSRQVRPLSRPIVLNARLQLEPSPKAWKTRLRFALTLAAAVSFPWFRGASFSPAFATEILAITPQVNFSPTSVSLRKGFRSLSQPAFLQPQNKYVLSTSAIESQQPGFVWRLVPSTRDSRLHFFLKFALLSAVGIAIIIAVTISVFWVIQDSLVYKPTKEWRGNPKLSGMPYYDDVNFCTVDGVEISGWFIKQPPETFQTSRTLIYFHGTDKNASFRLKKVVGLYEECKCNILLVSYRGYGLSSGKPNEKGMRIDAESAFEYLASRGDVDVSSRGNLWVYGESLGGAVAVHFTKVFESHINALILENTFTSLLDMIKLEFPILGIFRYLSRNRWQSKKRIQDIEVPILFLSGLRDSYIPPQMMKQMHALARKSTFKQFVEFEKGTHNRTWMSDGFFESVASFMRKVEERDIARSTFKSLNKSQEALADEDTNFITATA